MATRATCPKCRQVLHITQPPLMKVKCTACGAVLSFNAPGAPKISTASSPSVVLDPPPVPAGQRSAPEVNLPPHRPVVVAAPAAVRSGKPPVERPFPVASRPELVNARTEPSPGRGFLLRLVGGSAMVLLVMVAIVVVLLSGRGSGGSASTDGGGDGDLVQPVDSFLGPPGAGPPKIAKAVEKGVAYLKQRLTGPGHLYYFGDTPDPGIGAAALAGLTLVECNVPPSDPAVQQAIGWVRRSARNTRFTYTLALSVLFLDRLMERKDVSAEDKATYKDIIRRHALQMIAAQHVTGGWNYNCQVMTEEEQTSLLRQLQTRNFKPGWFSVPGQFPSNYHDNSISQFVTLALWAARKHGIPVHETLALEEKRYRQQQQEDGSWSYNERVLKARDATTCAGLIGLAVGRGIRDEVNSPQPQGKPASSHQKVDVTKDPAIQKGLLYVSRVIGKESKLSPREKAKRHKHTKDLDELNRQLLEERTGNRRAILLQIQKLDNDELATGILFEADAWGDLYFLWSLERVAMVYDLKTINNKDWYSWGAEIIVANQKEDGSWQERFPGVPDTCFALLFLKRVNIVKDLTNKLRLLSAALYLTAPTGPRTPALPPLPRHET